MAGISAGEVFARLGFQVDDDGAQRYERRLDAVRREARKGATAHLDVDSRKATDGLNRYERQVRDVDHAHGDLIKGSGRVRGALGSLVFGGAGVAAAGIGFAGLGAEVKSAYGQFEESNKIAKQTDAVLKSTSGAAGITAKQVSALATAISNKTGIDDEAIQSGENLLLTFTNVRNEAGKGNDIFNQSTSILADMSAALGQDTKSSAIQLGKALNDPIKGVTALQRVGVSFTAKQKEQIKTLVDHGKTLDAQKLILRELNKEFGGSAAAQATWGDKLKVTFGNMQEAIGKVLAPVIERAAKALTGFINGMIAGTGSGGRFVAALKGIGAVVKTVADGIGTVVGWFKSFGGAARDGGENASQWQSKVAKAWQDLKRTAGVAFTTVKGIVRDVTSAFSGMGSDLSIIGKRLQQVFSLAFGFILAVIRRALPGIRAAISGLATIIRGVIDVIAGLLTLDFGRIWDGVKKIVGGAVRVVGGLIRGMTAAPREVLSRLGKWAGDVGAAALRAGRNIVVGAAKGVANLAVEIGRALAKAIVAFVRWNIDIRLRAARAGADLVRALVTKAAHLADELWDAIKDAASRITRLGARLATEAAAAGRSIVSGIVRTARRLPGDLANAIQGGVTKIATFERAAAGKAVDAGKAILNGIISTVRRLPGDLWSAISGAIGRLGTFERQLASKGLEAGKALLQSIVNGIKSAPGAIISAISDLVPGPLKKIAKHVPGVGALLKRRGGKAGPNEGGPAVVYGEGDKTEWWISQEGDRDQNVAWAVEALHELTGRRVAFYRRGGTKAKPKHKPIKPILSKGQVGSAIAGQERGLANFDRDIARLERVYGQIDRENSLSVEELVVEQPDGSTVIDQGAIKKRTTEIDTQITFLRNQIGDKLRAYRNAVHAAIKVYKTIIDRLTRAIGRAKGSRRKNERAGYVTKRDEYRGRLGELRDKFDSLGLDLEDNRLDIQELQGEEAEVKGTKATAAPAADTPDTSTPADTAAAPDTTADTATPADTNTPAAPSAADIALAAFQEFTAFQAGRADLFRNFGANFMRAGGRIDPLGLAAGVASYGATGVVGAEGVGAAGGETNIEIHNHFAGGPQDPHTWSQQQRRQVDIALTP